MGWVCPLRSDGVVPCWLHFPPTCKVYLIHFPTSVQSISHSLPHQRANCISLTSHRLAKCISFTSYRRAKCISFTSYRRAKCISFTSYRRANCISLTSHRLAKFISFTSHRLAKCISTKDLLRTCYVLPQLDRSYSSTLLSHSRNLLTPGQPGGQSYPLQSDVVVSCLLHFPPTCKVYLNEGSAEDMLRADTMSKSYRSNLLSHGHSLLTPGQPGGQSVACSRLLLFPGCSTS